jgi:glycosyltransferase involved in cell wall biosynthesis
MPVDLFGQEWLDEERDQMLQCDFVTAPNDFVAKSLINAGVQRDRILETSYGWSPTRLAKAMNLVRPQRPPVFAYVGSGIIRKGLNLLLEAWERANINGKLLIAGRIDADIRTICARQLSRPDVQELGFVRDVANVYAAADIFVFPSHEEGGPQVTYEAAGCGLASIVSPMGAGRMVRDGREGYVIDPFDIDKWADAIRLLAKDRELRQRLADNASLRANEFTWQKVSRRLYDVFEKVAQGEKIDSGPSE